MQLVSLEFSGRYLTTGVAGVIEHAGLAPGEAQEILIQNLSRPDADNLGRGDQLLVRFAATNKVWRSVDSIATLILEGRRETAVHATEDVPAPRESGDRAGPVSALAAWTDGLDRQAWALAPRDGIPRPADALVVVRNTRASSRGVELALALVVPTQLVWRETQDGTTEELIRGMRVVREGDNVHLQPLSAPQTGAAVTSSTPYVGWFDEDVLLALSIRDGRLVASLGGEPSWFRVEPTSLRVHLRTVDGQWIRKASDSQQILGGASEPFHFSEITLVHANRRPDRRVFHGDIVQLRDSTGHYLSAARGTAEVDTWVSASAWVASDPRVLTLRVLREDGAGELRDGDRVRFVEQGTPFRALSIAADARHNLVISRVSSARSIFQIHLLQTLWLMWNGSEQDHASVSREFLVTGRSAFTRLHRQARVFIGPRPGTVALKAFEKSGDTITLATELAEEFPTRERFEFRGIQGYVLTSPAPGAAPLVLYYNTSRADSLLAFLRTDHANAGSHGYLFASVEGYAFEPTAEGATRVPIPATPVRPGVSSPSKLPSTILGGPIDLSRVSLVRPTVRRPRRALVLSGGGAKGCFEVGAASYLWERGYRPDIICGVSVGAINAAKLASRADVDVNELVALWRTFSATKGRIYRRDHYLRVLELLGEEASRAGRDTVLLGFLGLMVGGGLQTPFHVAGLGAALLGLTVGGNILGLDDKAYRVLNALATLLHSVHSMEPLRQVIRAELDPAGLRDSGIDLRVGITDLRSGQFLNVTQPLREWSGALAGCGLVEVEPDHSPGDTWLTRPLYGTQDYVVNLADAIYASSTLPSFMEPLLCDLRRASIVRDSTGSTPFTELLLSLPDGILPFLRNTGLADPVTLGEHYLPVDFGPLGEALDRALAAYPAASPDFAQREARLARDGALRGRDSWTQMFFDGGLRDAMALRTAMRLGADEITVISVDRLQHKMQRGRTPAVFPRERFPGPLGVILGAPSPDPLQSPAFGHVNSLLQLWTNEVARTDLLLPVAYAELLGWLHNAASRLDPDARQSLLRDIDRYSGDRARYLLDALGAASPLGGRSGPFVYGALGRKGIRITWIGPDRELVDSLDFDNAAAIEDGMALGYRAAQVPIVLTDHLR